MSNPSMSNPYQIKNHRLYQGGEAIAFKRSPNQSRTIAPTGIILHDTAGRLDKYSSVNWFLNPQARASAHFTIERDGTITQQVALNRRAWHAGRSRYKGRKGVNAFAFGIELVNPGKCSHLGDGRMKPWFGAIYQDGKDGLDFAKATTSAHGTGWWLHYSAEQIDAVTQLCQVLREKYNLSFITAHWDISPGRKIDTNPLFPLQQLRDAVFGEEDKEGRDEDAQAMTLANANLRRWPSYNDNVIQVVPKNSTVTIIRSGYFRHEQNDPDLWHLITIADQQGWMHGTLVEAH